MGLKIDISYNLKIVTFLDVTLNLNDNSYKPFSNTLMLVLTTLYPWLNKFLMQSIF